MRLEFLDKLDILDVPETLNLFLESNKDGT